MKRRLAALRQPRAALPLWAWSIVGFAYYLLFFFVLASLLGSTPTPGWTSVALALVAGKPLGVIGMSWLMVRLGWCRLPPGVSWGGISLVGLLAGIGFTMSIFISLLAFTDETLLAAAKLGILLGSLVAAILGLSWGALYVRRLRLSATAAAATPPPVATTETADAEAVRDELEA